VGKLAKYREALTAEERTEFDGKLPSCGDSPRMTLVLE
jgi:hypothetical protein